MPSRLDLVRPAIRPSLKARMMISAPSGAGKTRTALMIAAEVGGDVLVIDTEKESALTYADDFTFNHLAWRAPYDPLELAELLADPVGYENGVVIVDSLTHFWRGEGGTLSIADGKFTGWKEARPVQDALVKAILSCPAHVILCVRSDMAYEQTEDANGKKHVDRVGMKPQQDGDLVYELNVGLDMDMQHNIVVTKTRTTVLPINRTFRAGRANVAELARTYAEWLAGGEPLLGKDEIDALVELFNALPGKEDKIIAKRAFVAQFGRPEMLRASQLDDAERWIRDYVARGGPDTPPDAPNVEPEPPDQGAVSEADGRGFSSEPPRNPLLVDGGLAPCEICGVVPVIVEDERGGHYETYHDGEKHQAYDDAFNRPDKLVDPHVATPTPDLSERVAHLAATRGASVDAPAGEDAAEATTLPNTSPLLSAPSAAQLAAEGIDADMISSVESQFKNLADKAVIEQLDRIPAAIGGTPQERFRRLVSIVALQRFAVPADASPTVDPQLEVEPA